MIISHLLLQQFRSYEAENFTFHPDATFVVGANTSGKSNLIEAIYLLTQGKSFRTEKDNQMVRFGNTVSRVKAEVVTDDKESKILEVVLAEPEATGNIFSKRYLINGLPKRRIDFADVFHALLFEPSDLDIISGSPSLRRDFLDEVLEQTDKEYRYALLTYTKAIRQRNALLQRAKETGIRQEKQFNYWDEIVIQAGTIVTESRAAFINYLNTQKKELFPIHIFYDQSRISRERLDQYKEAEVAAAVTLVGPHRDDVTIYMGKSTDREEMLLKSFGSRGQQRLAVLQMKLLQLSYLNEKLTEKPVLLLDDIFSELDEEHIKYILKIMNKQQTIVTTTHKEFLEKASLKKSYIIEMKKK
jgi:DNA replication and repair protein RecF